MVANHWSALQVRRWLCHLGCMVWLCSVFHTNEDSLGDSTTLCQLMMASAWRCRAQLWFSLFKTSRMLCECTCREVDSAWFGESPSSPWDRSSQQTFSTVRL